MSAILAAFGEGAKAAGKVRVFGILKRGGHVYALPVAAMAARAFLKEYEFHFNNSSPAQQLATLKAWTKL